MAGIKFDHMKNIVITGTSRGIGFELAKQLAEQGHQIIAVSRNSEPIRQLKNENIKALSVDLSNPSEISNVAQFVKNEWTHVDILINNAGLLCNKPFKETSAEDFMSVYQVNVFSVASMIQVLLPTFSKGSHVLNISSIGGVQGSMKFPGLAAYSSSKGALITLTELLAEEYKSDQISFNVLALGAVQTEMLAEAFPGYQAPVNAEQMANYIANFALTGAKFYNGKILQVSSSTP